MHNYVVACGGTLCACVQSVEDSFGAGMCACIRIYVHTLRKRKLGQKVSREKEDILFMGI